MATKPNPVASSTPVDIPGAGKMVQDWDAEGNPYGQPHAPANPNLDSGFSIPANQIKSSAKKTAPSAAAKPTTPKVMPQSKPQGTQSGHAVTNNANHTRTVK